jgi:hypothetical protein
VHLSPALHRDEIWLHWRLPYILHLLAFPNAATQLRLVTWVCLVYASSRLFNLDVIVTRCEDIDGEA